jgi:DNA-directed RNA polymerase specialized sigma24 family protein
MILKKETKLEEMLTQAHHDYKKRLNAYAFSKVHDHSMSDDLVQDTFIKTWRYLVKKRQNSYNESLSLSCAQWTGD